MVTRMNLSFTISLTRHNVYHEIGMLRALGMRQKTLIQILVTKSFVFSIPGVAIGLFVSFLCNIPIAQLVANFANIDPVYRYIVISFTSE
jgi:ABC-type antimicrobial peptide transport system permease subunit